MKTRNEIRTGFLFCEEGLGISLLVKDFHRKKFYTVSLLPGRSASLVFCFYTNISMYHVLIGEEPLKTTCPSQTFESLQVKLLQVVPKRF